jgi:hypothetical protein
MLREIKNPAFAGLKVAGSSEISNFDPVKAIEKKL